jgi:CheY-like chemotaxis protein
MSNLSQYSSTRLLIIDDLPEMRSSMRSQVANLGMSQTSLAASVREALDLFKETRFDIILCDYYLGGNTDGQQFLEFIRNRKIISRSTIFIMITAEKGYESVITAAECMPDDYLLKPFTGDALKSRIDRLLEKKLRLARIDKLQDQGRWEEIIPACNEIIATKDKYLLDAMRIKGNALIVTHRYDEAVEFYQSALQMRPMPWAKLGLARALQGNGDHELAKRTLNEIVAETPQFLAAYDALGNLHGDA